MQNYGFNAFPQGVPWVTQQEADSFIPPPGLPTLLFIRNTDTFVTKCLDGLQRVKTEMYQYKEIKPAPVQNANFVTREDLQAGFADFADGLRKELEPVLRLINQGGQNNGQLLGQVRTADTGRTAPAESAGAGTGYAGPVRRAAGNDAPV